MCEFVVGEMLKPKQFVYATSVSYNLIEKDRKNAVINAHQLYSYRKINNKVDNEGRLICHIRE